MLHNQRLEEPGKERRRSGSREGGGEGQVLQQVAKQVSENRLCKKPQRRRFHARLLPDAQPKPPFHPTAAISGSAPALPASHSHDASHQPSDL